jgi:hypothetical protein
VERAEAERRARDEAQRLAREAAERADAERKARDEAQRKAREEAERLAKEAEARAEAERLAKEAAAKAEAERLAKEAAAKAEEQAPVSSRKPISKDDYRPLDTFPGLDEEEIAAPESGEVASQRKPTDAASPALAALEGWVEDDVTAGARAPAQGEPSTSEMRAEVRYLVEAGPPRPATPAAIGPATPIAIDVTPETVRRRTLSGEVATFVGAVRRYKPETFGDLLDMSLALGKDESAT